MEIVDILDLLVPNVWTALTQLCATAILFFLMYKFAWNPVKNILDQRSEYEQQKLTEAAALKEENEKIAQQAANIIADANRSAEAIVKDAREEGQNMKNDLIKEGEAQSAQLLENAKRDMELQKDKMMEEMRAQLVDTAIAAAEKVLQGNIDADAERQSINAFVKEVIDK